MKRANELSEHRMVTSGVVPSVHRGRARRSMRLATVVTGVVTLGACVALTSAAAAQSAAPLVTTAGPAMVVNNAPVNLPAWPVLSRGNNESWPVVTVRSLQHLLNAHGSELSVDGLFGSRTEAAVLSFQREQGLHVDGVVGEQTWSALISTVRYGSVGAAVAAVQEESAYRHLTPDGSPALAVDGVFGVQTEEWVLQFQAIVAFSEPMPVDGIVGPLTWRALIGGMLAEGE